MTGESTSANDDVIYNLMYRLTAGLPQQELKVMSREAQSCSTALEKEIELLEAAAASTEAAIRASCAEPTSQTTCVKDTTSSSSKPIDASNNPEQQTTTASDTLGSNETAILTTNPTPLPPSIEAPVPPPGMPPIPTAIPSAYDPNSKGPNHLSTVDQILFTELTPLDRYFCISALLGRLRDPLHTPPPPHSALAKVRQRQSIKAVEQPKKKGTKKSGGGGGGGGGGSVHTSVNEALVLQKVQRLIRLKETHEVYTRTQTDTTALLALWKRISNNRTAAVFRRPVNVKEAPGYDKILFPIDLGLIKKMIVCGHIQTFEELHQKIGMICHNCVLFNGRESDYAILTRDFENYVDDSFLDVMQKLKDKDAAAGKK